MKTTFFAVLAAVLAFSLAAAGEEAKVSAARARVMDRTIGILRAGDAETAFERFSLLVRSDPSDSAALLWQARAALAAGRQDVAKANFDALLAAYPHHEILRREAYEAFSATNDAVRLAALPPVSPRDSATLIEDEARRRLARSAAISAWDAPRPSRPAAALSESLFKFTGRLSAGFLYDSNVTQGAGSGWMRLGDYHVQVDGRKKTGSAGAYLGAYFGFARRLSALSDWAVVGDLNLYARGYARSVLDDSDNREWQTGRATAGFAYASGQNYFEARGKFQVFDYEFENRVFATGADLAYVRALNENVHLVSRAGFEWRDYHESSERDGIYGNVGQSLRIFFGGTAQRRHSLTIGATYYGSAADKEMFRYHAGEASVRLDLRLPCRFTVSPHLSFAAERYRKPGTILEVKKRRDDRLRAGLDLRYDVNDRWSLEAFYAYTRNDSNSALFDYDQHTVGAGMSWGF